MDAKGEAKAKADGERHAEEFRKKHSISVEEWNLAEEMMEDLRLKLVADFWKLWEVDNGADLRV
jgi:uncharacterized tellurite resistance protein B-like protein